MFRIHMLPAAYGDALLLEYGRPGRPHFVLIDGGPYSDYLDNSVEEQAWRAAQDLIVANGSRLSLMVITHIDADHIEGIVKLLNRPDLLFRPADTWFNGWDHLSDHLGPVEGELLSTQIREYGLSWNEHFDGRAVVCRPNQPLPQKELPGGMRLTLLSPTLKKLEKLAPEWEKVVRKAGLLPGQQVSRSHKAWQPDLLGGGLDIPALARTRFRSDYTEANGSSIAFLAEYDGKTCLFAADAHPKVLETSLKLLLQQRGQERLALEAFKLSHHGSKSNLSPGLLNLLDSRRYLVSTNGDRFDHPDDMAMARILQHSKNRADAAFNAGQDYTPPALCFNYASERTRPWADVRWQREFAYTTVYPEPGKAGLVVDV